MEKRHRERLRQKHPEVFAGKTCVCLFIADHFEFMDPELITLLQTKMEENKNIDDIDRTDININYTLQKCSKYRKVILIDKFIKKTLP